MSKNGRKYTYHQVLVSDQPGGGAAMALSMARHMQERGCRSHAWIPGSGAAAEAARELGVEWHSYSPRGAFEGGRFGALLLNWSLGRALRRFKPGLVHVHSPYCYGVIRRGLRMSGLKRIVHVHLQVEEAGVRWAFRQPPEMIVTCAEFLEHDVRRMLPEPLRSTQRIVAAPNAVDLDTYFPGDKPAAKRAVGAPLRIPLVLMLANLSKHKGQETVIDAVRLLKDRGVAVECWFAGSEREEEGRYTAFLKQRIADAGVGDRVQLLGQRSDAPLLLRAADFVLLPSTCEGLPLSLLEAQASRVPVLAAPTAGIPEIIDDGETGYLIAADDAPGYAARLQALIARPELAERVAEAAYTRTTVERTWSAYCRRLDEIYAEVAETASAATASPARTS
jgi:glycosyltransferase involved in cell wall biosynthesis